jgi:hypothetical protein
MKFVKSNYEHKQNYLDKIAWVKNVTSEPRAYFNDCPTVPQLIPVLEELSKKMPNARFLPDAGNYDGNYQFTKFDVVMDNNPFTLGWIGYGDWSLNSSENTKLTICSRLIANNKYASHRDQYYMVMPHSAVKAIKEACKYLLPYSTRELGKLLHNEIRNKAGIYKDTLRDKATGVTRQLGLGWSLKHEAIEELKYLKDSGFAFKTNWLDHAMLDIDEAYAAYQEYMQYNPNAKLVRIENGDNPVVHVLTVDNVLSNGNEAPPCQLEMLKPEDVPDDVAGKVAVLQTLDNNQYVERVGMRWNDYIFWVEFA